MGQRTVIIVKKTDRTGKSTLRLVHHQWGYAKVMPCQLMKEFLECEYDNNKTKYKGTLKQFFNFTNNKYNLYSTRGLNADTDIFNDKNFLQRVYNRIDNNNGAMLVEIVEKPNDTNFNGEIYDRSYVRLESVKIGFLLGSEECIIWDSQTDTRLELEKPFDRVVSAREYMEKTGGKYYCPNEFIEMFENWCKFYGIEDVAKETVEEIKQEIEQRQQIIDEYSMKLEKIKTKILDKIVLEGVDLDTALAEFDNIK